MMIENIILKAASAITIESVKLANYRTLGGNLVLSSVMCDTTWYEGNLLITKVQKIISW